MAKHLLSGLLLVIFLSACISAAHYRTHTDATSRNRNNNVQLITSRFLDADTTLFTGDSLTAGKTPVSLMELPRTIEGAFVLLPGFYEADFKTYCLQPGTPGPSTIDAYFQAPLQGARKEIIESILLNSRKQSHLDQKNIQLLLWSVVSRSQFNKLSPEVQSAAWQLLTAKQVFELNGGVLGVAKTVTNMLPSSGVQNSLQKLFEVGSTSYEAYERLAVLSSPSQISRPHIKRDQWYKHLDGYYVRYLPNSYQQTKIQVYVPDTAVDSVAQDMEDYIVFDPTSMVIVPANSNAQRLGVGAPVREIVGKVIDVIKSRKESPRPKKPESGSNPPKQPNNGKTPPMTLNGSATPGSNP